MGRKKDIRPIYHLHIPRTSGTNVLYEAQVAARRAEYERVNCVNTDYWSNYEHLRMYTPEVYEFMYTHEKMHKFNYVSGHFAINPIIELNNPIVFSFVRDPVSQFISSASYRCMSGNDIFTSYMLDEYIDGKYDVFGVFQGLSGCENPQSKFLASRLAELDFEVYGRKAITFIDCPQTLDDVLPFVDQIIIGTVENRSKVIEKINIEMKRQFGVTIRNNTNKVNSSTDYSFTVSSSQIKKIKEKVQLDEEIYQYVKNVETKKEVLYV